MSKWLASVQSLAEAQTLLPVLPDILDMKAPAKGALGALDIITIKQIVELVEGHCQTSATIGDLPMNEDVISGAMHKMTNSGVDYIKVGLFPGNNVRSCITQLATTVQQLSTPVIAVLFVDKEADLDLLPLLKASGFYGVMIDTAIKNGQHLRAHWSAYRLGSFVQQAHKYGLFCGLAGALRCKDIPALFTHNADYLGFRSALCHQQNRIGDIDVNLVYAIQNAIDNGEYKQKLVS